MSAIMAARLRLRLLIVVGGSVMGPCARVDVKATLVPPKGQRFVGRNEVRNPQLVCPRGPDDGYEMCGIICQQPGHAEIMALRLAGMWAIGATMYVEHKKVCDTCAKMMQRAGVVRVVLGPPPD